MPVTKSKNSSQGSWLRWPRVVGWLVACCWVWPGSRTHAASAPGALEEPSGEPQRRGETLDTSPGIPRLSLPYAVLFGETWLSAGTYGVSVDGETVALVDLKTMLVLAAVPVDGLDATSAAGAAPDPGIKAPDRSATAGGARWQVSLARRGTDCTITVRYLDHLFVAKAQVAPARAGGEFLAMVRKQAAPLGTPAPAGSSSVAPRGDAAALRATVQRYLGGLVPCAEHAVRAHWQTDDPRFINCVCPWVVKWRLPPVEPEMRVHHDLLPGKAGFSFTASWRNRPKNCRVWRGKAPPKGDLGVRLFLQDDRASVP